MEFKDKNFTEFKKKSLMKLASAYERNEVDSLVIPLLTYINQLSGYVTTSSCAGRIIVMELPSVGDKKNAIFHGKFHSMVTVDDINESILKYSKGQLWFISQSPIFHIAAASLDLADILVKKGVSAGFKHSGFKTINDRIIVELCSTERMDVPIGLDGSIIIQKTYINYLIAHANDLIKRGQSKLQRLEKILDSRNSIEEK